MNTNHKVIRVMKQAAAPPDRLICLSKGGGDGGPQVTRGPVLGVVWASAPQSPRENEDLGTTVGLGVLSWCAPHGS